MNGTYIMTAMGMPGGAESEAEALADALDVLRDLPVWHLAAPRWERVEQLVESIALSLAAGDLAALRDATADLELVGPIRVTRIGASSAVPAPPPVRERANHLVHSLEAIMDEKRAERRAPLEERGDRSGGDQLPAG